MRRLLPFVVALAACGSSPTPVIDADGDGFARNRDCDDRDPDVFPGEEVPCAADCGGAPGFRVCQSDGRYTECLCPGSLDGGADAGRDGGDGGTDGGLDAAADAGSDGGPCLPPRFVCDGRCVPSDAMNCGRCDNACGDGEECNGTDCVCDAAHTLCGSECVTLISLEHCGACFRACGSGTMCYGGGDCYACVSIDRPDSCPCVTGGDNYCMHGPGRVGCPMTMPGGYCDPDGDGSFADGDWCRGFYEHALECGS